MSVYDLIVFVHVAAAVALVSSSVVASPRLRSAIRHAGTANEARAYLAVGRPLLVLEPGAALLVMVSGIYLASVANFWAFAWVQVAVACWVANSVVAAAIVKPVMGGLAEQLSKASEQSLGRDFDALRWSARWSFAGDLLMANDAAMLYLMTVKPGLVGSLVAVTGTNVAVAVARLLRRSIHGHTGEPEASAAPVR